MILTTCADRERLNPLDPRNPNTGGRPSALNVISIQDTVILNWDLVNLNDLSGYKLQRRTELENDFTTVAQVDETTDSFRDIVDEFNTDYSYRYTAVGETYESDPSSEVSIEPGPTFNWVADFNTRRLFKLTHDTRYSISSTFGFSRISDIAPNPVTGDIWVVDIPATNSGRLIRVRSDGQIIEPALSLSSPTDLSVDFTSGAFWVSDSSTSLVSKFDALGNRLFDVDRLSTPVAVAVDRRDGGCWIGDDGLQQIIRIDSDGSERVVSTAEIETSVCCLDVDSRDGSVWVAETDRILKLDEAGEPILEINAPLIQIQDIAVNDSTGELWVINLSPSMVLKYSENGEQIFELDDFDRPQDLEVRVFDNSCLVADTGNRRVVQISQVGTIVRETDVLTSPGVIAVAQTQSAER